VSLAAWNEHHIDTAIGTVPFEGQRALRTAGMVREILSAQGLREAQSVADEGFYFEAEGASEITIVYNAVDESRDTGLLKCCQALSQHGLTLTLFLSERTSALFVRTA
jgi:hypothetical protein